MSWRVGEILIQKKLITWQQLDEILREQKSTKELTGQMLIRKGYVSEHLFYQALAEQHEMRFVELSRIKVNPLALAAIAKSVAEKFLVMPIDIRDRTLLVAITDPTFGWPENELKKLTGFEKIKPFLALPDALRTAIYVNYGNENLQYVS